jgi:hypothetical protein
MISPIIEQELREHLSHLAIEQQRQVVNFARTLATTRVREVEGKALLQFAGTIEAAELAIMARAIEDDCEQVNTNEWQIPA